MASTMQATSETWSNQEHRLTTYVDFDGLPSIIETDDRTVMIFWTRKTDDHYNIFYVTSRNRGTSWSQATQLTFCGGANSGVSALQTADKTIWLVWASDRSGNYDLYYKTSIDYGASWSNDTQLTDHASHDLKPTILQMSNGEIWTTWSSDREGDYNLYLKTSSDNGGSWSNATQLTAHPNHDKMPSLVQIANGSIWLVWASSRTGNYDLYYKTSSNLGASWSDATQLTDGPKVESNPCVLQTMNGKLWLFWSKREPADVETATDDLYYMYSSDNGATWSDNIQFTTDGYDDIWPSVTQSHFVRIWVVWTSDRADQPDYGNYDLYYRTSLLGDVNEDWQVDVVDLTKVSLAYGFFEGEPGYDPESDINTDGLVDMRDLTSVAMNLGTT